MKRWRRRIMELLESSSNWIIALGKTVLNSLWLGFLILSLLKASYTLIPARRAFFRYHAALLMLLIFTSLTTALFFHLYAPAGGEALAKPRVSPFNVAPLLVNQSEPGGVRLLYHYISLVYFTGMGIYLASTLLAIGRIRSIRRSAVILSGIWNQRFEKFKRASGAGRKVELLVSERIISPFLTGVLKPAVIVPAAMLSQLSMTEIEAILMHELYHLKRFDHVMNLVQKVLEILYFFNPAIWILSRIIRSEREKRCDDLVIAGHSRPLDYARALYSLSLQQQAPGYPATAATGSGKGELKNRIERILKPDTMNTNFRERINALLLFSCGILLVLFVSGFTSGFSITLNNEAPVEVRSVEEDSKIPVQTAEPAPPPSPVPITQPVQTAEPAPPPSPVPITQPDTITGEEKARILKEVEEAMAEINWEEIKTDIEEARRTAMEEIDWDEMKTEIEEARRTAMEEIDWDEMKKEIEEARRTVMEEINWDEIKEEIEEARRTAMEEIDWDEIKESMDQVDWDEIKKGLDEIDWEQMKKDMAEVRVQIDSMMVDFDFDLDFDMDMDMELDSSREKE
ncbi:MAG: hypothetical protein GY790_15715 [Bacteroidetes bacterium]|nr:hypothetical protein [Bacteroidota bacterium]